LESELPRTSAKSLMDDLDRVLRTFYGLEELTIVALAAGQMAAFDVPELD